MRTQDPALSWSRWLVAFVNEEMGTSGAPRGILDMIAGMPPAEYVPLRLSAERELRWIAGEWRSILKPLQRARGRGEPPRGGFRAAEWKATWNSGTRGYRGHRWLRKFPVAHGPRKGYDAGGRLRPVVDSAGAFVAETMAELLGSEPPALIQECELKTCGKLFLQPLHGEDSKRTPNCCCTAHASTLRGQRKRAKDQPRRAVRKK
jgi:hypothetical protein